MHQRLQRISRRPARRMLGRRFGVAVCLSLVPALIPALASLFVLLASPASFANDLALAGMGPKNAALSRYELHIDKSDRALTVRDRGRDVRRYRIALGRGGAGDKQREGDRRTPVGTYRIVDFNEESRFHLFMHINYPNVKDAFFGYKNGTIDRPAFDRIISALKAHEVPPQDTPLGSAIGIHGLGEADEQKLKTHELMNWTAGCIALTNEEIEDLRRFVDIGTKVVIEE